MQYVDRPETIEGVRDALGRDLTGSSFIAWTLVRKDQKAFLVETLVRALRGVARPDSVSFDLTGAIILLVDYGSDRQLDLEQATKERFGAGANTAGERDQTVARAIAWLDAQGIPH